MFDLSSDLRVAGWLRSDSRLRADVRGRAVAENDLPLSYGAGAVWRAGAQAALAGTLAWRNWASGADPGPNAHNTFNWALGAELGPPGSPLRLGARGGQLAFGVGKTPTEMGCSEASAGNSPAVVVVSISVSSGSNAKARV